MEQLKTRVNIIWRIITDAEDYILTKYPNILLEGHPTASWRLPKEIIFKTAQQLHDEFPNASIHERENKAVQKYGAIFIAKMGWPMDDGSPAEEQRSPSYDDWNLNVSTVDAVCHCIHSTMLTHSLHKTKLHRATLWFSTP